MEELYCLGSSRNQTRGKDHKSQGRVYAYERKFSDSPAFVWYLDHESLRHIGHELGGNSISQCRGRSM